MNRDEIPGVHIVFCWFCEGWASFMTYRNRLRPWPEKPHGCFTSV